MQEPTRSELERCRRVGEIEWGAPPYDFTRVTYYEAADGRWIECRERAHLDADPGTTETLHWITSAEGQAALEAERARQATAADDVVRSGAPQHRARRRDGRSCVDERREPEGIGGVRQVVILCAFFAVAFLLCWLIAQRWF